MLTPNGMANEIISVLNRIPANQMADRMMPEVGHAIAKYLTQNTTVMYSWVGIQPNITPIPDPVVVYTTNRVVGDFACHPTKAVDPIMHGVLLGKQITDGIRNFNIMPPVGYLLPPGKFLCNPPIILPPCPVSNSYQYWLLQSSIILTFYRLWINPVPLMGSHGVFLAPPGAGAIMTLIF
jgi:hypothetical protein